MEYRIYRDSKIIRVATSAVVGIGWLGFTFAKKYRGLVESGWRIHYFAPNLVGFPASPEAGTVSHDGANAAAQLAALIEAGPPPPPKPKHDCPSCECKSECCR